MPESPTLALALLSPIQPGASMLRISTVDTRFRRKLILEGKLVEPWLGELRETCRSASQTLAGRKLVIDLTDVTVISCEAESTLSDLMHQGAKFSCAGVLIKHLLKRLARKCGDLHKELDASSCVERSMNK
jgi:hypothetical protein